VTLRNVNQHFLVPLPGKVERLSKKEYWYHLYHTDAIEEIIYLYSNRITLGLSTCVCYAGWCMTSFDLSTNNLDDPEVLLRKAKPSLKKVLTLELEDNWIRRSLTQEFEAMANKTLRNSLLQPPPIFIPDHKPMLERMNLSSSQHISNTFWRSVAFSLSKE
jgi:hypothetical protein